MSRAELRKIPPVDELLEALSPPEGLFRPLAKNVVQDHLDRLREAIRGGEDCPEPEVLRDTLQRRLEDLAASRMRPVINATGVILHTNLGRAPHGSRVRRRVDDVSRGYCNLEIDLSEGQRGGRGAYGEALVESLTGAPAAAFVNNCSAALLIALRSLAEGREVLISRGELVQIGGGFRIPEILETGGASLREIGTTNRTSLDDYREAMGPRVGMILKVHRSNFEMQGFTEEPGVADLAALADREEVPLVVDLGSGALWETGEAELRHEPRPSEALQRGADLVTFSGDKLLGGPQAGLMVGDRSLIRRVKKHPLFRAIRCGKTTLAALEATLEAYLEDGGRGLPIRRMLEQSRESLMERARRLRSHLGGDAVEDVEMTARVGGGALPMEELFDVGLRVTAGDPVNLLDRLRSGEPPVVAPLQRDAVEVHLRTVLPEQDDVLTERLASLPGVGSG